jgi:hypothetical protein
MKVLVKPKRKDICKTQTNAIAIKGENEGELRIAQSEATCRARKAEG